MTCRLVHCPYCYANVRGRAAYKGHRAYRPADPRPKELAVKYASRVDPAAQAAQLKERLAEDDLAVGLPALMEYMLEARWPDGNPRQTSTLMLTVDDGAFKACLNDRANNRSLWVSGRSLEHVLGVLEATLQSGGGEWRKNQTWQGKRR